MTKKQYLHPEMLVSKIQANTYMLVGTSLPDPNSFGIGGGGDPGESV